MDRRPRELLGALCGVLALSCGPGLTLTTVPTDAQSVCYNVDECAQGGSYNWLQSCEAEALTLQQQSDESGCGSLYSGYYACANSNYTCQGITPLFPGCDTQLSSLEACLNARAPNTRPSSQLVRPGAGLSHRAVPLSRPAR
jgi:hypothetical protein